MKKLLLSLVMLLTMVSFAQAYTVSFDWDGTGGLGTSTDYNAFQLNQYGLITTYQDKLTGNFEETFTLMAFGGYEPGNSLATPFMPPYAGVLVDITLRGNAINPLNVSFSSGEARMYDATNEIATFDLSHALPGSISGTLLGSPYNFSMNVDLGFEFLTVNSNYWGLAEQELVGNHWLLALTNARIFQSGFSETDTQYVINWRYDGGQMEFEAVPEPSTILLLGSGLLGVALFGRRKLSKKS